MLQASELTFDRPGGFSLTTEAIDILPGRIYGILGPNGSGKSTFLHLLTGLLEPSKGTITWEGKTRRQWGGRQWARRIAAVPQESGSQPEMSVRRYVTLGRIPHEGVFGSPSAEGHEAVTEALRICRIAHFADRRFAELSGGQRQRVRIAQALAQTPRILILDEPANHLDLHAVEDVAKLLRTLAEQGISIVVSLHDIDLASHLTDEVMILQDGQTQAVGETTQVLTHEIIRRCWGVDIMTIQNGAETRYLLKYVSS